MYSKSTSYSNFSLAQNIFQMDGIQDRQRGGPVQVGEQKVQLSTSSSVGLLHTSLCSTDIFFLFYKITCISECEEGGCYVSVGMY